MIRHIALTALALALLAGSALAEPFENPKVKPPRAKPHRRAAAESLPPLPLPATPLRRSERKREPAPPALVGMINFSAKTVRVVDGERKRVDAFPTTQVDIERLMKHANNKLKIRYRYLTTDLETFSGDPTELPLLYVTGWTPMPTLSEETVTRLRRYLYDGGTLVLHAQCGRPEFWKSAKRQVARIFPKRDTVALDTDSPIYHAYYDINTVRFRKDDEPMQQKPPYLEAVYLGLRPAIIVSPIDLNCSWNVTTKPIEGGVLYHHADGLAMGTNIITTVLANVQYARAWGREKLYPEQDESVRDQLVIAQLMHDGDWDPTPHALPNLMKFIQTTTTLNVQFKRETMRATDVDLFKHPVIYMTGLRDFTFTEIEVARLRTYLQSGGVLIADAAAGRKAFDVALRREIARVLPTCELKRLPLDAPIYATPETIRTVDYSDLIKAEQSDLNAPLLEGMSIDGQLAVVYSPVGLAAGWEQLGFAYNRGYADADALRLGINIITYAMMH
ncbi:MAG: DUF4159 domain-containing protein [Planctomycetes bacterium]|nr:DUF4159 domain-containing protein [Phycisphaerae bacterium]NBB96353.1 DUF4159 domain-containing protein [Planctomycetota bacterium]